MEISEQLRCLFSGQIEKQDESYVIEIPERELQLGDIGERGTYRVAILPPRAEPEKGTDGEPNRTQEPSDPPVDEGETRTVEIEDIGDQGDGIASVERGYIVIVPETEQGERVRVEIANVRENVAFADVIERLDYYE